MSWLQAIPYPHLSPVFFEIGPLQFRWYGLMYLIGLTAAYFLITRKVREKGLAITKDQIYDMVVWARWGYLSAAGSDIPCSIIFPTTRSIPENFRRVGRRHVVSWRVDRDHRLADLVQQTSGHSRLYYCRSRGLRHANRPGVWPPWKFHQRRAVRTPRRCSLVYGVSHRRTGLRHPSQLYEAGLEGLLLFTVLWLIGRKVTPPGTVFWSFLTGYGLCRIVVELFREPDAHIGFFFGSISMGQLLSLPMIVMGIFMLTLGYQRHAIATKEPFLKPQ